MSYCIVVNQFASSTVNDDDEEIVVKSSKIEMLSAGAIIGTVAIVLLLSTCVILLVISLNRLTRAAVYYETEQSQHNPAVAATVEGVQISQVASYTNKYITSYIVKCSELCSYICTHDRDNHNFCKSGFFECVCVSVPKATCDMDLI